MFMADAQVHIWAAETAERKWLMPLLEPILMRHPRLKLTLSHLGLNSGEYDEHAFRDLDRLLALARWPNVNVKWSALPAYTRDGYPLWDAGFVNGSGGSCRPHNEFVNMPQRLVPHPEIQ